MKKAIKSSRAKKKPDVRLERQVRITFFSVAGTADEIKAVKEVSNYLESQYKLEEDKKEIPVTGFTHSTIPQKPMPVEKSVFVGHWWHTNKEDEEIPLRESVVFFLIDLPALPEEWKTDEQIANLKKKIFIIYEDHGCPQDEIWIVKQDSYRYA